jgi:hypothetical protein
MVMVRRLCLTCLFILSVAVPCSAQNLIDMFRTARVEAQAAGKAVKIAPLPPVHLATVADSFPAGQAAEATVTQQPPETPRPFNNAEWEAIRRLVREPFEEEYGRTQWAYLGNQGTSFLDTSMTRVLRARLEHRFGSPTRRLQDVLAESGAEPPEYIQFEYWLVLNDSIPVKVMDTGGPFDRGVVLATDERYRNVLPDIRYALMTELTAPRAVEAYSDYYYERSERAWYFTQFDGVRYYTERVPTPMHMLPQAQSGGP